MNLQLLILVEDVQVVDYHNGKNGKLNDNLAFCEKIEALQKQCLSSYRPEEYYDSWIEVYRIPDNKWAMYFTQPTETFLDGYIITSTSFISLWKFVGELRNQSISEYPLKNKIDETVEFFIEKNQKR